MSKSKRGFASMSEERKREIAAMGGRAQKAESRSFARDPELASRAGALGGQAKKDKARKTDA